MSSVTNFLKLFKWDTKIDGSQKFNIDKSLNENWDKLDTYLKNLEIGGRNLLLDSKREIRNSSYIIAEYTLAEVPIDEQEYTFSLKGKLGEGKTSFRICNSISDVTLANLKYDSNKDIYTANFKWKSKPENANNNTKINIYTMQSSVTSESSIEWVKLEKGNKNTDWMPALEDIDDAINTNKTAIGTLSSLTSSDKTSLVNAINELRLQTFAYMRGNNIGYTNILTNKTFDDAMNLEYSTIFTINGNEETKNGAGFPTGAYQYGLLITLFASSDYAKTQIYIPDKPSQRGFYIRTKGDPWCLFSGETVQPISNE